MVSISPPTSVVCTERPHAVDRGGPACLALAEQRQPPEGGRGRLLVSLHRLDEASEFSFEGAQSCTRATSAA
eukprot:10259689-Alexandrium_andersonii.AAC.1